MTTDGDAGGGTNGDPAFRASRLEDLGALTEFVGEACRRAAAPDDVAFAVRLAVEEAFTNVVQHGYGRQPGPVRVEVRADAERITVTLVDEAPPFDPRGAPAPALDAAWDERAVGGLGWHLVHQLMDEVRHERLAPHGNLLTLVKRLNGDSPTSQGEPR
jgi:serine/threonine-protein kinase RsbW